MGGKEGKIEGKTVREERKRERKRTEGKRQEGTIEQKKESRKKGERGQREREWKKEKQRNIWERVFILFSGVLRLTTAAGLTLIRFELSQRCDVASCR